MGVLDNPRKVGNWAVNGVMGASNILTTLGEDGYEYSDEEKVIIKGFAHQLLAVIGESVTNEPPEA